MLLIIRFVNYLLNLFLIIFSDFEILDKWTKYQCDICTIFNDNIPVIVNGDSERNQHLISKKHKSNLKLKKQFDENYDGQFPSWFKKKRNADYK